MNILLIYPEFPDTFWRFKHALKLAHIAAVGAPHGCRNAVPGVGQASTTRLTAKDLAWAEAVFVSAKLPGQASKMATLT